MNIHLGSMTTEELLSYFRLTRNDLTTTRLEEERSRRLELAFDHADEDADLEKEIEQMTRTNSELQSKVTDLEDRLADIQNILNG